jgi:hypothetical protein
LKPELHLQAYWPASPWPAAVPWGILWVTNNGQYHHHTMRPAGLSFYYEHANVKANDATTGSSFTEMVDGVLKFATGGPLGSTARRLYQFSGSVTVHHNPTPDTDEVPWSTQPEDEAVADGRVSLGSLGNLDASGNVYALLEDNVRVGLTPTIKGADDYSFPQPSQQIITLNSLTVASNAVAVGGTNNWAAVKTNDYVYVRATLSTDDTNAANLIQWSVGDKVAYDPFQRKISKATSQMIPVTATLGSSSTNLNVWIIWGTVTVQTSGLTPTNAVQFVGMYDGTENLGGQIVGNDAVGKVVPIALLTPVGIHAIIQTGWGFHREMWSHTFLDGVPGNIWNTNWVSDDSESWVQNLTPDEDDKIYDRDAPNIDHFYSPNNPVDYSCVEINKNFHQWIEWNGIQASGGIPGTSSFPDGAMWHWKAKRQSNANPQPILKDVSGGNINIPNSASGCP